MTDPLKYLLITVKVIELEKVSLSDMQNPKTGFNTLTADDKYSLLNRDNLTQKNQMYLPQKEKFSLNFSLHFFFLY